MMSMPLIDSQPGNSPTPVYEKSFPILDVSPKDMSDLLRTQLRMANIMYWIDRKSAVDLCSFVMLAAADQYEARHLYVQAAAIRQQVLAEETTANGAAFLPVLTSDHYRSALTRAIDIAHDYQLGYKDLCKQTTDLKNLEAGWDVMISQAGDNLKQQELAATSALARWQTANTVYEDARQTFALRVIGIAHRASEFKAGIDQYKVKMGAQLFLTIFTTVISKPETVVRSSRVVLTTSSSRRRCRKPCCGHAARHGRRWYTCRSGHRGHR